MQTHAVDIWVPLQENPVGVAGPFLRGMGATFRTALTFDQLVTLAPDSLEGRIHNPGAGRAGELRITTQPRLSGDADEERWEVYVELTADALSLNGEATYPFVMRGYAVRPEPVALSLDALADQLGCATLTPNVTFHDCVPETPETE